jgi:Na+-transporting NADH:ubiquinone oxidoreductase subunit NqrF
MSSEHISPNELADGIVLACRVMAESDLSLQVVGKLSKAIFWEGGASG